MKGNVLQRGIKNSRGAFVSLLAIVFTGAAGDAFAQTYLTNICTTSPPGFLAKIVPCISNAVINATQTYLVNNIGYFTATVNVIMTAAVLFYAFTILTGRTRSVTREGVIVLLKIGGVALTMNVLVDLFPFLIDSIVFLVNSVGFYLSTPQVLQNMCPLATNLWENADCALAYIVGGILPGFTVANGLFGFLVASLFSGGMGVAIFFLGMGLVLVLIYTMFQAVFTLLSTFIALALLMAISPLMVPLVVLRVTKGYFDKWLRLVMTVILQPMFLFAYLTIMLIAMESVIFKGPYSLYNAIACNAANQNGFNIGGYIRGSSGATERQGLNFSVNQSPETLATPTGAENTGMPGKFALNPPNTNINAFGKVAGNLAGNIGIEVPMVAIDYNNLANNCGNMDTASYILRVLLAFIMAAAMAYVMYALIGIIPYLGSSMTGELFGVQSAVAGQISKMSSGLMQGSGGGAR